MSQKSRVDRLERVAGTDDQVVIFVDWTPPEEQGPVGDDVIVVSWDDDVGIDRASYERELYRLAVEATGDDQDSQV